MQGRLNLYLLILCGIWSLGFIGAFADENITDSSSFLVRQKRVISQVVGEDKPVRIEEYSHIVYIKALQRLQCVGTILSQRVILTTAYCACLDRTNYVVVSGSSRSNHPTASHNVTMIKVEYNHFPDRRMDGIALFYIDPPIVYSRYSFKIDIHVGPVLQGMHGTVIGWGYNGSDNDRGTNWPINLRAITVPILAHQVCVTRYRVHYTITDKDICTFHPMRHAGHSDFGAPLVIDNMLVGIFLWRGPGGGAFNIDYPDVFAFLQHIDYKRWIEANI